MERTVVIELDDTVIRVGLGGELTPRFTGFRSDYGLTHHHHHQHRDKIKEQLHYMITVLFSQYIPFKPKECRVLVVEKLLSPRVLRDCLVSILLLDFQVLAVSLQPSVFLPILSSRKSSGIIIEMGNAECTVIAVAHGYILLRSLKIAAVGIENCIKKFKKTVEITVGHEVDYDSSKDLFEKVAMCSHSSLDSSNDLYIAPRSGVSSSGFTMQLSTRQSCFNHIINGVIEDEHDNDEYGGVAGSLLECLRCCPHDVRSSVSSNIMFCGQGSDIPGLSLAICKAATDKAKNDSRYESIKDMLNTFSGQRFTVQDSNYNSTNLSWIGGSLFSSLKSNDMKFIKLKDVVNINNNSSITSDDSPINTNSSGRYLNSPDWMSLSAKDWCFFGPKQVHD